jgi:hypothetical protein
LAPRNGCVSPDFLSTHLFTSNFLLLALPFVSDKLTARTSIPRSSYYDKHYKQSAALMRARRPYLVPNLITGAAIFGFAIGVCM